MNPACKYSIFLVFVVMSLEAVELAAPFSDGAVLQRDLPVPIWGTERPGTTVTVTLVGNTAESVADAQGAWKVVLPRLAAGGPHRLSVTGTTSVTLNDLMVGEVWICSGQSNMEWTTIKAARGPEEVAQANHPNIRLLNLKRVPSDQPLASITARWQSCTPATVKEFSAVGYFFGRELARELQVPIGLISASWGATGAESWVSAQALEASSEFKAVFPAWQKILDEYPEQQERYQRSVLPRWEKQVAAAKEAGMPEPKKPRAPFGPTTPQHRPGSLYNGMIAPLVPYGMRGVLWYQGETNATETRAEPYRRLLPLLISDWRRSFGTELTFHLVQLANYGKNSPLNVPYPVSHWAVVRESQAMVAATVPGVSMAVAIDIGEANEIHPANKQEVGRRLALNALAKNYARPVESSGPVFQSFVVEGAAAAVSFTHAVGLAAKDGALRGFRLAGDDGRFIDATGVITGSTITLTAPGISAPVAVRYAWDNDPQANLVNASGLPASPFRHPQR